MNRIILTGRLTRNPELRQTQTGRTVTSLSIAVNRGQKDAQGDYIADFFNCQAWEKTGEFICKYFVKGDPIELEGQMRNNNYTDQNGIKHYAMVVNVDRAGFAMTKKDNPQQQQYTQQASQGYQNGYNNQGQNYQGSDTQQQQQAPQSYQNSYNNQQQTYQQQSYQNNYSNGQQAYQQSQYQNQQNQYQTQQPVPQNDLPQPDVIGDLSEFEEIISDGSVPF